MSRNPSEDETGSYRVLCNEEGQYSLWPAFADVPRGWSSQYGPDGKAACLAYVEKNWTDMRPRSLVRSMQEKQAGQGRE
jgi:MbtH protein